MDLLRMNSASRIIRESRRLLVYSSCLDLEAPWVAGEAAPGAPAASVCMEAEHLNVVALKIASIMARVDLEELSILTVDGSPHCLQLHHAAEEAARISGFSGRLRHMIFRRGKVEEVSREAVKAARYLSKVQRMMPTGGTGPLDL